MLPADSRWTARVGTALALSVPIGGAATSLLLVAGLDARTSCALVAGLSIVLLAMRARSRRLAAPLPEPRRTWAVVAAFVLLTAAFPAFGEWWRIYSDNWTHAAIVRSVERSVPPLDPGFAGVHLQYAWIYHAFVAGLHALAGVDVFALMLVLSSVALAGTMLATAGSLSEPRDAPWTLLLLGMGLNAAFPLFLPLHLVRAFSGEVRGTAELARIFNLAPLQWDTTGPFLRSLGGEDFFLDKFMVVTPFALSLAALAAWVAALRRWLVRAQRRELVLAASLTLGAGLMHPVTGVFLGASSALAAVGMLALSRRSRFALVPWAIATCAGLVPVVLYTKSIIGGSGGTHSELPFDLAPLKLVGYVTCLALGLLFAFRPLARAFSGDSDERPWAYWTLAGLAVAIVSRLPGPSPFFTVDKLAYLVWIPLVIAGGPAFARWMRERGAAARVLIALLCFVPVNGLALASRALDPHNAAAVPWDLPGFAWLREQAPKDAVLLVQPGDWESMGFGQRDQYYSEGHPTVQLGYDLHEYEARKELATRFFATGHLVDADRARLARLGRPVYAVWADFRAPLWRWTPGTIARGIAPPGPKPAFDPALPVVFTSPELEIRRIPLP
jgi:hypothetical protein